MRFGTRFAEVAVDKSTLYDPSHPRMSVPVRRYSNTTELTSQDGAGYGYRRTHEGISRLVGRLIHNLRHNNIERPVESALRRPQPLDPHVVLAPPSLEVVPLPFVHRMVEIERVAVSEVQPWPAITHSQTGYIVRGAA